MRDKYAVRCRGSIPAISFREAPHNIEAEQALLGAILINNDAMDRVTSFLEPAHFFDPVHGEIFETASKMIHAGKQATPITLKTFFDGAEPIDVNLTVPQYLGRLAANATTIINARDYGRTIYDLAARRSLIALGEDMVNTAYDAPIDAPPILQIDQAHSALQQLRNGCDDSPKFAARCLADIASKPIPWLWPDRIALGKVTLIAGQPGLGKSQLTLAMVAAVTTGAHWPDMSTAPLGSAILVSCEDDASDTIRPRLEAAGADTQRIDLLDWVLGPGGSRRHFDIAQHTPALADLARRRGDVRLIVIDPVSAYMGSADTHKTADVRGALVPLQTLAAELGAAVVLVSHLNKSTTEGHAMNRVAGSGAFVAVCRSAWLVATDPQDGGRRRLLTPLKNNIGDDRTGFAFTLETAHVAGGIATSRVKFDPTPITVDANDLLRAGPESDDARTALEEARMFLRAELAAGPQPAKKIEAAARDAGIAERTLARARRDLGVVSRKGREGWRLQLPGQATDA